MRRLATAILVAGLAGCAGIPDSGRVTKVEVDQGPDQSTVRYSPTGPTKGATPQEIVRGYLDAMLAFPVTTGTAASFLTPEAAREWKSSAGVAVYVDPDVSTRPVNENARGADGRRDIDLDIAEDAALDKQGRFERVDARKTFTYRLAKTKGEWRIANPQDGFLVNRKFFDDYYRPFSAYFFDRPGKRLVADPIYLPVGDQLSTALVSSMLLGPGDLLGKTARTYVPDGATLRTSVPLRDDRLAEVQFREELNTLTDNAQEHLSAQIIWTLRQVEQVRGVRITGGDSVLFPENRGVQSIDAWGKFGQRPGDSDFHGVQKGRIVELNGGTVAAVNGPWGKSARKAVDFAVDARQIAVVELGRSKLTVGSFDDDAVTTYDGEGFLRPLWDDSGAVWAVDRSDSAARLRIFKDKKFRQIPMGKLADLRLDSFALSPDGARYAAISRAGKGSEIYVGPVLRDADDLVVSLGAPRSLRPKSQDFTSPRSLSWASATVVTFVADDSVVDAQIFESRVDGSTASGGTASEGALLPEVTARTLATSGGNDPNRYVVDSEGHAWLSRAGSPWERLGPQNFTALAASRP